jgi:hypothetical protein
MISFRKKVLSLLCLFIVYEHFECAMCVICAYEGMNNTSSMNEKPGMKLFLFGSCVCVLITVIIIARSANNTIQPLEIGKLESNNDEMNL